MQARDEILKLLNGDRVASLPAFSGLSHILKAGLESEELASPEIHRHAEGMARAAASTFRLTGLPSAAVPFDLCVEAEALGASVDFRAAFPLEFPRIASPLQQQESFSLKAVQFPAGDVRALGRVQIICDAIAKLRGGIGSEAVIGGILAGPFTVLSMLLGSSTLFQWMKQEPEMALEALLHSASFISRVGRAYRESGADFLTIHEMGGSPDVLGARRFEFFVLPSLKNLLAALPAPRVLAVCGNLEKIAPLLEGAGAEALSADQSNDLRSLRLALPHALLFGNLDPLGALARGNPEQVHEAVRRAAGLGVDAIWPGCDLLLDTPPENVRALAS